MYAAEESEGKSFDAKEVIFEHVLDNYGWEVPFSHSNRIPLPVIVRDKDGNWSMFGSHRIMRGEAYNGYYIATDGDYKGKIVTQDEMGNVYRPVDLSITKNVMALFITALLLCLCFIPMARWYRKHPNGAPRKWFGFMELVLDMLYNDLIKPVLGADARRYSPYLLTVFFFIFFINILGLMVIFPAGANLSGNISITLVLALCTFFVVNFTGTKHYWKDLFWARGAYVDEVSCTVDACYRDFRSTHKTGGSYDTSLCQYVGWTPYRVGTHFADIYFWLDGGSCSNGNYNYIGVFLAFHDVARCPHQFHTSLCIYYIVDDIHQPCSGEGGRVA